jgi:hypothetical protein
MFKVLFLYTHNGEKQCQLNLSVILNLVYTIRNHLIDIVYYILVKRYVCISIISQGQNYSRYFSFVSGGLMSYYLKVLYDYGLMSVENVTSFPEFYVYPSSFFLLFVGLAIIHHKRTKEFEKSLKNDEEIGSQNFEYNMHYVEELYKKLISSGTLQDYQLIKKILEGV